MAVRLIHGAPERCLAETPATLEVMAVLTTISVLHETEADLLGAEEVPMMMSTQAEEKAADDSHRATTGERGVVGQIVHGSDPMLVPFPTIDSYFRNATQRNLHHQ